ncbi:MAG: GNAT family N-acetyltransferase [Gammaproteobacteria bacterium RIFCSPHIGHO2_12_FULL_41_15]|nr:MAG: GNAT family N-acetyltransferase [Gammaproteobacteria bacterium RIFCSPHIGHO2_12_FULL_41_15]
MTNKDVRSLEYVISPLGKKHNKSTFSCGVEVLDLYLKTQASQDIKKNVAMAYVISQKNSEQVIGYYTLSSMSIFTGDLPVEYIKKLPRYPTLPGIRLGRLAVDEYFQGKKTGLYLLMDAIKRSLAISKQIGVMAMIVDAKDEKAAAFYKQYGFIALLDNRHKLFLPFSTIKHLSL